MMQENRGFVRQQPDKGLRQTASANRTIGGFPRLRLLILAALALFLIWEVMTKSLGAYLADSNSEAALYLWSTNAPALLNVAQDLLDGTPAAKVIDPRRVAVTVVAKGIHSGEGSETNAPPSSPEETSPSTGDADPQVIAQIRSWAELALLEEPLNAPAFRILGQISAFASDEDGTEAFMQAAARRSLFESVAVYWMMQKSYQVGDYRSAIRYADVLLKTRPREPQAALWVLAKIAENPEASADLKQLLTSNPRWRTQFFTSFLSSISDARTPLDILLSLKDSPSPPTTEELSPYLKFLIDHEFYELAYYTWLQFLPSEQLSTVGNLNNGNFEIAPSGLPFDWTFSRESGATIGIADRTDREGGHALLMEFGAGRVEGLSVTQMVMLAPGNYEFHGKYKADIVSQRALLWRITCANKASPLIVGESPPVTGAQADWKEFEFSFGIPEKDCPAQYLGLAFDARSASEQFISGSVWYDQLQILRKSVANP
jgi:hypothetical protein